MKCSWEAALSFVALSPHFWANSRGVRVGWATVPSPAGRSSLFASVGDECRRHPLGKSLPLALGCRIGEMDAAEMESRYAEVAREWRALAASPVASRPVSEV